MSDSKLFVFGSFSEDETRSLLQKQSPGKAEKPLEKNVLQFGSINFVTKISSGECNGESSRPQNSVKGLSKVQPLSSLNKPNEVEAVKAANDSLPASLTTPTENGCTDNYKNGSAHSNGVTEATMDNLDVASLPLSNNAGGLSNQFSSLELQNREQNGRVDDLSASKRKDELFFREGWVTIKKHYVSPPRWWKKFHLQDGRRLIVINLLQLPPALY
ncbi:hypothetical protein PRUPE_6G151000 [Prunus persica]|uniref:Uncharacterized protein n=1 Tax=Prunus persica TaxID=3760 RepID=A0A251NQR7_PRUPE|nr:hypothetical protein PRUPE_6G151000 [Prunus persica]